MKWLLYINLVLCCGDINLFVRPELNLWHQMVGYTEPSEKSLDAVWTRGSTLKGAWQMTGSSITVYDEQ